jgi:hypothetical protein
MAHSNRGFFRTLVAISVVMGTLGVAQNDVPPSPESKDPAPADHGLLLLLSQAQTPEPSDSSALKTCLNNHPPLACVLLTITVENARTETILRWSMSCGAGGVGFDLKKFDGSWEPFANGGDLPICTRNVLDVQRLSPGESYVQHIRLADPFYTDTAFPPPDEGLIHPRHQGYAFLTAPGPHIIRARWYVDGCVASEKLKAGGLLEPFTARSMCVPGTEVKQQFIVLRSNELNLSVRP